MESLKIINTGEIGGRIYQDENMCSSGDGIRMIYLIKFPHIIVYTHLLFMGASLVAQKVKRLPAMQETQVQSLGQKDSLEKAMAIHSSTLAWKIPWMEEPDRLQSMGSQRVGHDWATSSSTFYLMKKSTQGDKKKI